MHSTKAIDLSNILLLTFCFIVSAEKCTSGGFKGVARGAVASLTAISGNIKE